MGAIALSDLLSSVASGGRAGCDARRATPPVSGSAPRRVRRGFAGLLAGLLAASLLAVVPAAPAAAQSVPTANADGTYTVPSDWPLIPLGIQPAETFRLLFMTTTWRDATVTDIAMYDAHVQAEIGRTSGNPNQIGHPAIRPYASLFRVVGSTASVDARDHTNMNPSTDGAGEPISWLNGPQVAKNYAAFWRPTWSSWTVAERRNQAGTGGVPRDGPWTGTVADGTKSSNPLGNSGNVTHGGAYDLSEAGPILHTATSRTQRRPLYGISPVFVVEGSDSLEPVFGTAAPDKTTVAVLHSSYDGVERYSYDGVDPYNRTNVYVDDRPGMSFMVDEHESCAAGSGVDTSVWHPDPSTQGAYRKLTYTVALSGPPPTWKNAVVAIFGPDDKHPRDRGGFKEQYDAIFKKQLAIAGRTSPMRGMGNQLPEGRVTVPTSRLVFSASDWNVPQEVEVWVRCANPHDAWEDIHIFHGVYPAGPSGSLGNLPKAEWFEVTMTVIDATASPRPTDAMSADAYPGRVHVHLETPGGGFNIAGGNWQVPMQLHWRTARVDAFRPMGVRFQEKVNDDEAARRNFRKFAVKVEGMAKGMSDPRSDGGATYADGDRLPTVLSWDVSLAEPTGAKGGTGARTDFEHYYPAYFKTPDLTKDSVVHSPGSPIYRMTVTPYSIRGNPVPGEAVQQCIHVRSSGEDPVTGVGATENKAFYTVACPSNFPEAPASQLVAEPLMLTLSAAAAWVDEGADATFTITADRAPLLDTTVNVYLSQEMGEDLNYVGAEEAAQVTLPAGQRSVDWTVTSYSDDQKRADGTIEARINPGDGYGVTNPRGVSVPFIDDDGATRVISVTAGADVIEGDPASFTVSASPAPAADLDVSVTVSQSGDFGAATGKRTVTIPPSGSATVTVGTANDGAGEADGSVTVTAVAGPRYTLHASDYAASAAVADDDYRVDAAVLATVYQRTADDGRGNSQRRVWRTVLVAFGLGEDNWIRGGMRAITAAEARQRYGSDAVWAPVIAELEAYEAAVRRRDAARPVVSVTAGAGVAEGQAASFTLVSSPPPASPLYVRVYVDAVGAYGVTTGWRTVAVPTTGSAALAVATTDDATSEPDGTVTVTVSTGNRYRYQDATRAATVSVADGDAGPALDPQLEADVRSYAAETHHGTAHVNRWKRVLEAFGLEDYAGLEPTTLDEARVHVDIGRPRWIPVLAHMAAMDPQPPPARGSVQIDAQVLAAARAKAAQTRHGTAHVNRWKRVLEAFGDGDYPGIEPLTAAGAQVYANVWSGWDGVAAQLRLIEAAAGADPAPVVPPVVAPDPVVSITAGSGVSEGGDAVFTVTAVPPPAAGLAVSVTVAQSGDFGAVTGSRTVTVPSSGSVSFAVATSDDSADEPDGSVTATVDAGSGYTVSATQGAGTVVVADDDAPAPSPDQVSPPLDAQLLADVRGYAAETRHGALHVNRWKRVLEAFGVEDYAGLEPTTLDEARVHVDIGRSRWVPVLAHMAAVDAADPQPPPARGSVQVDAQLLATARAKAGETHGGARHVNRWKRVLEAFGDADYPGVEPLTAAGAQVYANVWPAWTGVAAQIRLIEAAATTDPPPVVVPPVVIPPVVVPPVVVPPTPEVNITGSAGGTEGATVTFTLTATPAPAADLVVDVSVATSGDFGYGSIPTTATIPVGGTATVTVTTTDDSTDEPDGTVTLTIDAGSGYTVGAYGSETADVTDDDDPVAPVVVVPDPEVSITAGADVAEGGSATFTLTASPAPAADLDVAVTVAQSGAFGAATGTRTVTIPTGGSVSFAVTTSDDSADEPDGSVTATVGAGSGYTVSATQGAGTVAVADDDVPTPVVSITAGQGVTEGGSATFTLTASPAPAADLPVTVTVAQSGDFGAATGTRTVTVPTGGSVSFAVTTSDDSTDEPDGSVTATVDAASGYTVSATQGAGTVGVADNDDPPPTSAVTVSVGDATGSEAGGVVKFTVTLSEASGEQVRVWFSTSNWRGLTGRAHMWLDYWTAQETVAFAPGQTERTVSVWLVDDSRSEPDEHFTVTLTNPRGATIEEGKGTATGTITDDD